MNAAISFNFFFLNQLCVYAKYGKSHELNQLGLPPEQLCQIMNMSSAQLEELAAKLDCAFIEINGNYLLKKMEGIEIPLFCEDLIIYGASNKLMTDMLNISKHTCASWRRFVDTDPNYRQRSIPADCHLALWSDIEKLPNPLYPTAEELLVLAKQHAVSIGAIWSDIKKGNDDEKK
ncbi:STY4526/YPO1902 family pathogenicity island replication protein [Shewanella sp. M-Br]|uniref:STY4526/YPO1902 family pathogenicity island replication protein n=1 Tax=Shewanella sp. M-Br TaxID=2495595 RepID=UPI002949AA44|nr:hypothetical protein SMBr_28840 [Shewanella sp. M-Br]